MNTQAVSEYALSVLAACAYLFGCPNLGHFFVLCIVLTVLDDIRRKHE